MKGRSICKDNATGKGWLHSDCNSTADYEQLNVSICLGQQMQLSYQEKPVLVQSIYCCVALQPDTLPIMCEESSPHEWYDPMILILYIMALD